MITIIIITSIIATAGLGVPGDTPEHYKQTLKNWTVAIIDHVEDEDREEQALAILGSAATVIKETRNELNGVLERVYETDTRYDATVEDYEAVITSLNALWKKTDHDLIANRFELQHVLTEEEWLICLSAINESTSEYRDKLEKKLAKDAGKRAKQKDHLEKNQ